MNRPGDAMDGMVDLSLGYHDPSPPASARTKNPERTSGTPLANFRRFQGGQ